MGPTAEASEPSSTASPRTLEGSWTASRGPGIPTDTYIGVWHWRNWPYRLTHSADPTTESRNQIQGLAFWCKLRFCLQCHHPVSTPVGIPDALLPIQLQSSSPRACLGKQQGRQPACLHACTHIGDPDEGSWLWPGPVLQCHLLRNEKVDGRSLSLPLTISNKIIF